MDYLENTVIEQLAAIDPLVALAVMVAYACIDALNTHYTKAVADGAAMNAATTGAITYMFLAFGVVQFTNNPLYVVPLVAGSWLGTYAVVRVHGARVHVYNESHEQAHG
jgi:uncharacterized membrane protein YfcA